MMEIIVFFRSGTVFTLIGGVISAVVFFGRAEKTSQILNILRVILA